LSIWLPNSTCVPFSTSDTKRICGYALAPRLAPGREKASSLAFSSATSKVLPSRLTRRQVRYHAPRVLRTATGLTNSSCNCRRGFPAKPCTSLRDARFARNPNTNRWVAKPLDCFQQATQYLAIGRLHVQRQSDDVIDNHLRRQIALTKAALSCV